MVTAIAQVQSLAKKFPNAMDTAQKKPSGVLAVMQQDWQHLCGVGTQVRAPAWHGGLGIWRCYSCSQNFGLDLIPGPGTPYTAGWPKKGGKIAF